jgi:thioredoxin 1
MNLNRYHALALGLIVAAGCRWGGSAGPVAAGPQVTITDATFAAEVEQAKGLVLVDFWAEWCGPCRVINPILARLATEYEGRVKIGKVNVDHNPDLSERFQIRSIPLVILFKDGRPVDSRLGARPETEYRAWIEAHLRGDPAPAESG